jgi:hypothetical protein
VGITDGVAVRYNPATGEVRATGGLVVPNALFRSITMSLPDAASVMQWPGGTQERRQWTTTPLAKSRRTTTKREPEAQADNIAKGGERSTLPGNVNRELLVPNPVPFVDLDAKTAAFSRIYPTSLYDYSSDKRA